MGSIPGWGEEGASNNYCTGTQTLIAVDDIEKFYNVLHHLLIYFKMYYVLIALLLLSYKLGCACFAHKTHSYDRYTMLWNNLYNNYVCMYVC